MKNLIKLINSLGQHDEGLGNLRLWLWGYGFGFIIYIINLSKFD